MTSNPQMEIEARREPALVPTSIGGPLLPPAEDPGWFRRAVFYEVYIRGFFDANDDGTGDIPD
jgi:maltose alpha-D-glucosyltransferase/alpha-amylase